MRDARPRTSEPYLFANRMKVLVHDGIGIWLSARRLHQDKFVWPKDSGITLSPPLPSSMRWCSDRRGSRSAKLG